MTLNYKIIETVISKLFKDNSFKIWVVEDKLAAELGIKFQDLPPKQKTELHNKAMWELGLLKEFRCLICGGIFIELVENQSSLCSKCQEKQAEKIKEQELELLANKIFKGRF